MHLRKEEVKFDNFTKGLLYFTIPLVASERHTHMSKAMDHLASIMSSSASSSYSACLQYLEDLRLDAREIVSEANEMATRLIIPPVREIVFTPPHKGASSGGGTETVLLSTPSPGTTTTTTTSGVARGGQVSAWRVASTSRGGMRNVWEEEPTEVGI